MNRDVPSDDSWTDAELDATVRAYLQMLQLELQGESYSKADYRRELLIDPLARRTAGSIEYRMQNISALRDEMGLEWIRGYKPARNVGTEIKRRLAAAMREQVAPDELRGYEAISFGAEYRKPDEDVATSQREPFDVDPDRVDRGLRAHRHLQNEVGDVARAHGLEPKSPDAMAPNFDVGWWDGDTFVVVEVKSISSGNEASQLRLGIGQVLDYAFRYQSAGHSARAVLAVEREPAWSLVFEALQVSVEGTREQAIVRGVLPYEAPKFVTTGQTSA